MSNIPGFEILSRQTSRQTAGKSNNHEDLLEFFVKGVTLRKTNAYKCSFLNIEETWID